MLRSHGWMDAASRFVTKFPILTELRACSSLIEYVGLRSLSTSRT